MMASRLAVTCLVIIPAVWHYTYATPCKFSNENCDGDGECCSRDCYLAHPGTNPRCTKSAAQGICLYSHHCEEDLECGDDNKCCSQIWGTCGSKEDCCDKNKRNIECLQVKGFVYKRCLDRSITSAAVDSSVVVTSFSSIFIFILAILQNAFVF